MLVQLSRSVLPRVLLLARGSSRGSLAPLSPSSQGRLVVQPARTVVYSETGAVLDRPEQVRFGLLKVLLVVVPFVYLGATMSKSGAAFLEENDIFVPAEEDD